MKYLLIGFILIGLFSCRSESNSVEIPLPGIPTSVSGKVNDFQRNIVVPNYAVIVIRQYKGFCGYMSCTKTEIIASTVSDQNGNYNMAFKYINDNTKEDLVYFISFENANGYFAESVNINALEGGTNNIRDINAWKPIKINFNLNVKNCNNLPLYAATILKEDGGTFNNTSVQNNGVVSINLEGKPSSTMFLKLNYIVNGNSILAHQLIIPFTTTNSENQSFNFEIDCNTF